MTWWRNLEVKAVRERVGHHGHVTAFTKVEVIGAGCLCRVAGPPDRQPNAAKGRVGITLTHMLNRRGRIELETTMVRMAKDRLLSCVCAAFFEQRLLDHLVQQARARGCLM